jgi:hypothetical protein
LGDFSVTNIFQKVNGEIDFGHFKNVHIWNSEKSFEKVGKKWSPKLNGLVHRKNNYESVTTHFLRKV